MENCILSDSEKRDSICGKENTLQNILDTLQRIEKLLQPENQHIVIKEAVSYAVMGDKFNYLLKDAE